MARYNVLYFCTVCRRIHPTEIYLPRWKTASSKWKRLRMRTLGKVCLSKWQC